MRLTLALLCLTALSGISWGQPRVVSIGVAVDGPWDRNDRIRESFESEIRSLLGRRYEVQFPQSTDLEADWTREGVSRNLDRLLADPDIDAIIALGVLSSNEACSRASLAKPVIAPFVLDVELQGTPTRVESRVIPGRLEPSRVVSSGKKNLSYVVVGSDILREVEQFREIVPFKKLTVLSMNALVEGIPELRDRIFRDLEPLGLDVTLVRVGTSLDEALAAIPAETEAVYVTPMLQLSAGDFKRLSDELIARKLPSFSLWGESEVRQGLLASLSPEQDLTRLGRRVALNLHSVLLGDDAGSLPIEFDLDSQLTINLATGRAIGVYPSFSLLTEAVLLNQRRTEVSDSLSLERVVRLAEQVNLDLAAADRTVAAGEQSVREARANLLPQAEVSGLTTFIDGDRADASFGSQGRRQQSGTFSATQLLYSEQARAGYSVERSLQIQRSEERVQLRLDVVEEAATSYLGVLRAKTAERIQQTNLALTRSNLDLARTRVDLGASGREEVFRWESQIALNRRDLINAGAQRNQAEIAVNRVLNRQIEAGFATSEESLSDPGLTTSFEVIRPYVDSQETFRVFRRFMVEEAFAGAPELRQLDAGIRAQERVLLASKRRFYVPTVAATADVTTFKNGGTGDSAGSASPDFEFPTANSLNWTVALNASLPLFQGGALRAQRTQAEINLDLLTVQREATRQRVEQRIRSMLHQARASFAAIDLTEQAAEAARNNLELVRDAYSEGAVDLVRLLDAQNQTLTAELGAANAIFDYLLDLIAVQRATGRFDYFRSVEDRNGFLDRMDAYFDEAEVIVRRRE